MKKPYSTIEFYDNLETYRGGFRIKRTISNDQVQDAVWKLCDDNGWLEESEEYEDDE